MLQTLEMELPGGYSHCLLLFNTSSHRLLPYSVPLHHAEPSWPVLLILCYSGRSSTGVLPMPWSRIPEEGGVGLAAASVGMV